MCEDAINYLSNGLTQLKSDASAEEWKNNLILRARRHPIKDLLDLDPLTYRCFTWPKGYQGDAETIDYIYYPEKFAAKDLSRSILDVTIKRSAPSAVRKRKEFAKQFLAKKISDGATYFVSLGGGHLREWSELPTPNRTIELVSLDSDLESLNTAQESIANIHFEPIHANVISLLKGKNFPENAECIYSLGLFDYLSDSIAKRLISRSFDSLVPGGELLIANFSPDTADIGYIEAFMNWFLIYRSTSELMALAKSAISSKLCKINCWEDESNIVYLQIVKMHN